MDASSYAHGQEIDGEYVFDTENCLMCGDVIFHSIVAAVIIHDPSYLWLMEWDSCEAV